MFDTHCHLDLAAFDADRDDAVARATGAGVTGMLVPGVRPATWSALIAFANRHAAAGVRCAIGVHPQVVGELAPGELPSEDIDELAAWLVNTARAHAAIAIGECGLDGGTPALERQETLFRAHIRASRVAGLPLVIHVLRAHDAAPRILREEAGGEPLRGVLHSYSGGAELVSVYAALGLHFSFAGPVTYPNARRPVEAARAVPAERLLAETDAPDQAPVPHRGGRSEPAYVGAVIAGLAAARGITADEVSALTSANARALFAAWE